jgi:hypothetical protein
MLAFNCLNASVVAPEADGGTVTVIETFGTIAEINVPYKRVPDPLLVNVIAAPPSVKES